MQQELFPSTKSNSDKIKKVIRRRGVRNSSWDKEHYKNVKSFMDEHILGVHYTLVEKYKKDPVAWAMTFFPLINQAVKDEDYEAAQATKDAIIDFLNRFGAKIPDSIEFKLPKYHPIKVRALVCYGKEDDPSGMASGGAEFISRF
jgi:hypothetical protein